MKPFHYAEHTEDGPLSEYVLAYWSFEVRLPAGEQFLHHVWPDGCVSLTVTSAQGALVSADVVGPDTEARQVVVEGGCSYRGVRFRPDAGGTALGIDPGALRGRSVPLHDLHGLGSLQCARAISADLGWPAAGSEVTELLRGMLAQRPIDAVVRDAVRVISEYQGEIPISTLARQLGLGMRQLQRRFHDAVGLSPKEYARVRRVRSGIGAVLRGEKHWSKLAASLGYADQAHLIRDFAGMTGLTPRDLEDRLDHIEHEHVDP